MTTQNFGSETEECMLRGKPTKKTQYIATVAGTYKILYSFNDFGPINFFSLLY